MRLAARVSGCGALCAIAWITCAIVVVAWVMGGMPHDTMTATHDVITRQDIVSMAEEILAAATIYDICISA